MGRKEEYQALLQTPQWKAKRDEIRARDGYACVDCGARYKRGLTIECHHLHYVTGKDPWDYPVEALVLNQA